jgi:hypothetical protein
MEEDHAMLFQPGESSLCQIMDSANPESLIIHRHFETFWKHFSNIVDTLRNRLVIYATLTL